MSRKLWVLVVVLVALGVSATAGYAANIYWRNNRYQLPGYYQSTVLSTILTDHKLQIDSLVEANRLLALRVTALEARMAKAEGNIATNTTDIATNAADIATNVTDIATNKTAIATNAADIATNKTAIATNAADIATNKADITTNGADILANAVDIATNEMDILANLSEILTNEADIATNVTDILANEANIATNVTDITTNTTAISTHVANTGNAHSHDARYVTSKDENLRTIRGRVDPNGNVTQGTGFTVTKGVTGEYTIHFDTPFTGNPTAVISCQNYKVVNGSAWSKALYRCYLVHPTSLAAADGEFTFTIIGPQ